jgi:hypothetical protein
VLDEEALLEMHPYIQERGGAGFPEERQVLVQPDRPLDMPVVSEGDHIIRAMCGLLMKNPKHSVVWRFISLDLAWKYFW